MDHVAVAGRHRGGGYARLGRQGVDSRRRSTRRQVRRSRGRDRWRRRSGPGGGRGGRTHLADHIQVLQQRGSGIAGHNQRIQHAELGIDNRVLIRPGHLTQNAERPTAGFGHDHRNLGLLNDVLVPVPLDDGLFELRLGEALSMNRRAQVREADVPALGHAGRLDGLRSGPVQIADFNREQVVLADRVVTDLVRQLIRGRLDRADEYLVESSIRSST